LSEKGEGADAETLADTEAEADSTAMTGAEEDGTTAADTLAELAEDEVDELEQATVRGISSPADTNAQSQTGRALRKQENDIRNLSLPDESG
jgi:hypothetical protein